VRPRAQFDNEGIRRAAADAGVDLSPYQKSSEASDRLLITVKGQETENEH
jgi:hypothetical protein